MNRDYSNNEISFALKSLREGLRLDSRDEESYRKISVRAGPENGHVKVKIGATRVVIDLSQRIDVPLEKRPQEGFMRFKVDVPSVPSPGLDEIRSSETSIILTRILNKTIIQSRCVDLESLCIVPGERVFALDVSVSVIDQDGNVFDCACLGVIAALHNFKLPVVSLTTNGVTVHEEADRPFVPLTILYTPLLFTFAVLDEKIYFLDPTNLEENAVDNLISIAIIQDNKISLVLKSGNAPVTRETLYKCCQLSLLKYPELCEQINKSH